MSTRKSEEKTSEDKSKTKTHHDDKQRSARDSHDKTSKEKFDKRNKLRTEGVSELHYDRYSATSFSKFERDLKLVAGQEYGDLFYYAVEGKYPEFTMPKLESVDSIYDTKIKHLQEEYDNAISEDDKKSILDEIAEIKKEHSEISESKKKVMDLELLETYRAELKEIKSKQSKYRDDYPKLYWLIRRNMSDESTDKIKEHIGKDWETTEKEQDPIALWTAIKDTHTHFRTGSNELDKQAIRQGYQEMKMHTGETLVNLKRRMEIAMTSMKALGMNIPSEEEQAQDFIAKIDNRWASMRTSLANDAARGIGNFPRTLLDAFQLASKWKTNITTASGATASVFATHIKDYKGKNERTNKGENEKQDKSSGAAAPDKTDKGSKSNKFFCHICQDQSHLSKECPFKEDVKQFLKTKTVNATITDSTKTQFTTIVCLSAEKNDWLRNRILFDPQAQSHIFCNGDYLTNIRKKPEPVTYTGQVPGKDIVTEEGDFMGITVDYNPSFNTNLLSGAECRIQGFQWGYDSELDYFWVDIHEERLIFNSENRLYTYNLDQEYGTFFTKVQEQKAREAMDLMSSLGYPSARKLIDAIRNGAIIGTGVSPDDVRRAVAWWGKPEAYLAGKMVWRDPKTPTPVKADVPPETDLEGHVDLMFINEQVFFVAVYKPIDLTIVTVLDGKGKEEKKKAFQEHLSLINGHGFKVKEFKGDAGDGFATCIAEVGGPRFVPMPPGRKDGIVESKIRRIKETVRCYIHTLPFKSSASIIKWAVKHATYCINLFPNQNGLYKGTSPREFLTGIKTDLKTHARVKFGEFCYVKDKPKRENQNNMDSRVFPGLALLPTGNKGSVFFLNLTTMTVVERDQFEIAKIPQERIEQMDKIGTYTREDIDQFLCTNDEDEGEDELHDTHAHMTIEQAISHHGEKANESILKEFKQFHEKKVFKGVPKGVEIPRNQIVPFKTFVKEKTDSNGIVTTLKTRGVGRGDRQSENIYETRTSPTASIQALFTVAAITAHEGKSICTYDFPGAYLNSSREGRVPPVYVTLNKTMTQVMTKVDPNWDECVREDGTSIAECLKALYGLKESGALWYEDVNIFLIDLGFEQSKYEKCVYFRKNVWIVLYVDDLFISYSDIESIKDLKNQLTTKFGGEFKFPINDEIEFLGMNIAIKNGEAVIKMASKIDDVVGDIRGSAETPAGLNLFKIDESSEPLDDSDAKLFHSSVAKLLYIAKRNRPDILLAVNFLTTRVRTPTEEDKTKLNRVLKYLKSTRDLSLHLKVGKGCHVHAYIDASYGVHEDMKSHTGAAIDIGDALAINVKSSKQKIVSKSSTEAELLAVSDTGGDVIHLKNFIEEFGYSFGAAEIYQDNTSSIHLMTNDLSPKSNSKHIKIRTFWIRERISEGEIKVIFVPTYEMIADGLTKPLQGSEFKKFRNAILGIN